MKFIRYSVLFILSASFFSLQGSLAEYFNRTAAEAESKPGRILQVLDLDKKMSVADIGAGGGYFTYRFSPEVRQVYAVDVNSSRIEFIRGEVEKRNLQNVKVIKTAPKEHSLPDASVDLVFMRNVFHHIENPPRYFKNLKSALKKGARVAIIDYVPDHPSNHSKHSTDPAVILREMKKAGYTPVEKHNFLKRQSFFIFTARE